MALNTTNALNFIKTNMYDSTDIMFRESTRTEGNNYYMNSANGLAYTVVRNTDLTKATNVLNQCVAKKSLFGKANTTIYTLWADMLHPLWLSSMKTTYAFKNTQQETWGSLTNGSVLNNNATGSNRTSSEKKLNSMVAYCMHWMEDYYDTGCATSIEQAQKEWALVLDMFDDDLGGYVDDITEYRESYKQGLVKYASDHYAELADIGTYQEATGLWGGTLQDATSGGIYMRYKRDPANTNNATNIIHLTTSFENTESTCAVLMGYLYA